MNIKKLEVLPFTEQKLVVREQGNPTDTSAVTVVEHGELTVGHVPKYFCPFVQYS